MEKTPSISSRRVARAGLVIAVALMSGACSKRYAEIEVRDPGRVAVGTWSTRNTQMSLPPDGSQRAVPLPDAPGTLAVRRGREIALDWEGQSPVTLVDEQGILPRTAPGPGIEIRGQMLWAAYNVTPKRVWPQAIHRDGSVPVLLTTEMSNVIDAREVREVRHWPAYVCLPPGLLFAVAGTALLSSRDTDDKVGGGLLFAGAIPLLVYTLLNLTSSNEVKPLDIPAGPPL